MRAVWMVGGLTLVLLACSGSHDDPASACADIAGNWQIDSVRTSGTCDPAKFGNSSGTTQIGRGSGPGEWIVFVPGVSGGCPGTMDASCRFTSTCDITAQDGTFALRSGLEYTFSNGTLKGTESNSVSPPIVPTLCTVNYTDSGHKL